MRLRRAAESFLEGYFATCDRSPRSIAAYRRDLEQFWRHHAASQNLETMTPEAMEAWAQELKRRGLAPASIRRKLAVLKIFFNYWVRKRVLEKSPLWLLRFDVGKIKPLTRTLTRDETQRLLRQAKLEGGLLARKPSGVVDEPYLALRNWAIVELLLATGIRVGEATSLRLEDVRLDERELLIRGKGGRQRLALLTEETSFRILSRHHDHRLAVPTPTSAVFLNRRAEPLSTQGISAVLRTLAANAGIHRRITPHMLRHTSATFLLQNGADLRIVQEFLGHASITTTQRYTHVTKAHRQTALVRWHSRINLRKQVAGPRPGLVRITSFSVRES